MADHRQSSLRSSGSSNSSRSGRLKLKSLNRHDPKGIDNENYIDDESPVKQNGGLTTVHITEAKVKTGDPDEDWDPPEDEVDTGPAWSDMSTEAKTKRVSINVAKLILLIGLLYLFICSLDLLGSAFRLLAGRAAGEIFQNSSILNNPVAGLMVGVLVTVLLQSSSTSTSIIVAMVGSKILEVKQAVYVIMGANIGTSVTSTIVAMSQAGDRDIFRRAFAGGTVHDMFNWLTVLVLLPLEAASGYLYLVTDAITSKLEQEDTGGVGGEVQFLQAATRPFTDLIVQVDEKGLEIFAEGSNPDYTSLLLRTCSTREILRNTSVIVANFTLGATGPALVQDTVTDIENIPCEHLFANSELSDTEIGVILLFVSLFIICGSLIVLVKLLSSMLKGSVAKVIKRTVNYDLPKPFGFLTGYIALLVGAGLTVIVQSSSVFTSTLTPLVGLGVITIERVYPLTLGSNIGTTATSVLAALSASASTFHLALQTSLVHLFFNCSGVLIWYSIPLLRKVPIGAAKILGKTTAKYRWFALAYIVLVFLLIPGVVFGLSLAGPIYFGVFGGLILLIFVLTVVINIMQKKAPRCLPAPMRTWNWLPLPLHSLKPMDKVMRKMLGVFPCCKTIAQDPDDVRVLPVVIPTIAKAKTTETSFQ